MSFELPFTIPALHGAYADGLTPAAVVEEVHARIAAVADPGIFIDILPKADALAAAAALGAFDPARPLWGIPFAIKDNIDAAGRPTTAGCPAWEFIAEADAFVVAKLRAAGAILIGKTNLDQFATGLVGLRTPYGAPLNSVDPAIVPGGSSGGSGVAVGHGIVTFSLGTDTAGSGRVPAALNNIVGLKPTLGALSATGLVAACRTLDTISIFALTVDDAYAAFTAAAGYDVRDAYSKPIATLPLSAPPPAPIIGIPDASSIEFFGDDVQAASFAGAVAVLKAGGAKIVPIDFAPFYAVAAMLYDGAWVAERHSVIEGLLARDPDAVHPITAKIIRHAETLSATDAFRGFYRLEDLKRAAAPALAGLDLLCVPTIPTFYSVAQLAAEPIAFNNNLGTYTNFVNLMDMCGIAVPTAPRTDGRPGSVTLLAAAGRDALTASVARTLEVGVARNLGATPWPAPTPAPLPIGPEDGMIDIAVCGAHMSGLPLNHQLTSRGGRFMRAARSAPIYRFHALAGGPPERPGMVRVASGGGAVALEIWRVPSAQIGSFLAGIPSPLGLGRVALEDGGSVIGFVCEAAGIEGARDITALGDWRAHVAAPV